MRFRFIIAVVLFAGAIAQAAPAIGTTSAEVRDASKRIDIPRTIDALTKLGVNTFYYLIWESPHDWDDLPAFARAAERAHIQVWVYIVPWSETPPHKPGGWGFSEPFRTDYIEWATQIAQLSMRYRNIVGYVIDDFYDNTIEEHFNVSYVRRMVAAGKRVNPKIKFYPLMYFQTPWAEFTSRFASLVDGVVICYPKSEAGVRNAITYLNDQRHGSSAMMTLSRHMNAERGDGARIYADINIADPSDAELSFYYDVTDQASSNTSQQMARVRIDNKTVWESQTTADLRDGVIDLDLYPYVNGRRRVRLEFDVLTTRAGMPDKLPMIVRFDDIRVWGAAGTTSRQFATNIGWHGKTDGQFKLQVQPATSARQLGRFHIPVALMPTGEGEQYEKRYDNPGTPQAVAARVGLCLDLMRQGLVEGVIPYRTPLNPNGQMFQAVQEQFAAYRGRGNTDRTQ